MKVSLKKCTQTFIYTSQDMFPIFYRCIKNHITYQFYTLVFIIKLQSTQKPILEKLKMYTFYFNNHITCPDF